MQPFKNFTGEAEIMAEKGDLIVAYLLHGCKLTINFDKEGEFESRWFNPRSGKYSQITLINSETNKNFIAPDNND